MPTIFIILSFFICTSCSSLKASKNNANIVSERGVITPLSELYSNSVILIFSYECGYSLQGIKFFNQIKNDIEAQIGDNSIAFIALTEFPTDESISKYPNIQTILEKEDLKWEKYPAYQNVYEKIWNVEVFPQLLYFKEGKELLRIEAPYENEMYEFSEKVIKINN